MRVVNGISSVMGTVVAFLLAALPVVLSSSPVTTNNFQPEHSIVAISSKSQSRRLAIGDYDALNSGLLKDTVFKLDGLSRDAGVGSFSIDNMVCSNLYIGDIVLNDMQRASATVVRAPSTIEEFSMDCTLDYAYEGGLIGLVNGNGKVDVSLFVHAANSITELQSPSQFLPPTTATVTSCEADLDITKFDVTEENGFLGTLLEALLPIVRGILEGAVGDLACGELAPLATGVMVSLIDIGREGVVERYLMNETISNMVVDPLAAEKTWVPPSATGSYVGLVEKENINNGVAAETRGSLGWFDAFMDLLDETVFATIDDTSTLQAGDTDYGLNVLIRESFLDENGVLKVNLTDSSDDNLFSQNEDDSEGGGSNLFGGGDSEIMDIDLEIAQLEMLGLDSLTAMTPLSALGDLSTTTAFTWEYLTFKVFLELAIAPSTSDNAALEWRPDGNGNRAEQLEEATLRETVAISLTAHQISVVLSALIALDTTIMEQVNIVYLLLSNADENALTCVLKGLMADLIVSQFQVSIGALDDLPLYDGFESAGMGHLMTRSINPFYEMYAPYLLEMVPLMTQDALVTSLNRSIQKWLDKRTEDNKETNEDEEDSCQSLEEILKEQNEDPKEATNPLSGQEALEKRPDYESVDLVDFTTDFPLLLDLGGRLNRTAINEETGKEELNINTFVRSLMDEDGTLGLGGIKVYGLDSISQLNLFDPIAPQTLMNAITIDFLRIELGGDGLESLTGRRLKREQRSVQENGEDDSESDLSMSVALKNVKVSLALLLALDPDGMLSKITLGSIMDVKNLLPCFISQMYAANVPQFLVEIESIEELSIAGLSDNFDGALNKFTDIIQRDYGYLLTSAIPLLFNNKLRDSLNEAIDEYTSDTTACPTRTAQSLTSLLDFRDLFLSGDQARALGGTGAAPYGDTFSTIWDLVNNVLLEVDENGIATSINDLIRETLTTTDTTLGTELATPRTGVIEVDDLLSIDESLSAGGLNVSIELKVDEIRVEQLDSIGAPLAILDPVANRPYNLNNTATIGVGGRPVRASFRFLLALAGYGEGVDLNWRNEFHMALNLDTGNLALLLLAKLVESEMYNFPLIDILNLNCWLAAMPPIELDEQGVRLEGTEPSAALEELMLSFQDLNISLTCIECMSDLLQEFEELLAQEEGGGSQMATDIVDFVTNNLLGGDFTQFLLDRSLYDAARKCPHREEYIPDFEGTEFDSFERPDTGSPESKLLIVVSVAVAFIAAVITILLVVRCSVRRKHQRWLESASDEDLTNMVAQQERHAQIDAQINESSRYSMFTHPDIPKWIRWSMPVIILVNILLFLSGHLSKGATVLLMGQLAGTPLVVPDFYTFSIAESSIDIWHAGGRELSALMWLVSILWPYTKQLISLVTWFLPTSMLTLSKRGSIFIWLDRLAKWSIVDVFVLVIVLAGLRVEINSPDKTYLPDDFYSVYLLVVPLWGLYANMLAQLVSQISSHFIIHYHRRAVHIATEAYYRNREVTEPTEALSNDDGREESNGKIVVVADQFVVLVDGFPKELCAHRFTAQGVVSKSAGLTAGMRTNVALGFFAVCCAFLILAGCVTSSFSFDLVGVLAKLVELGRGDEAYYEYSVLSVVGLLFSQAKMLDVGFFYVGLGVLNVLVLFSVLFVPILQSVVLLYLWFRPMTMRTRSRVSVVNETLSAWQYSEVYFVSVFVARQLGSLSEWMINAIACSDLGDTFAQLDHFGMLEGEDAQCFRVNSSIEGGAFVLLAGSLALVVMNSFVTMAMNQYYHDEAAETKKSQGIEQLEEKRTNVDVPLNTHTDLAAPNVTFTDVYGWTLQKEEQNY